jgi:hypothetical protein
MSLELCRKNPQTRVHLVDIDSLPLSFAVYRFIKHRIGYAVIGVSAERPYPALPVHNVCLARDVMEHVHRPEIVCAGILKSLSSRGLLYGNFADHRREPFHVCPNLGVVRDLVTRNFKSLGGYFYERNQ